MLSAVGLRLQAQAQFYPTQLYYEVKLTALPIHFLYTVEKYFGKSTNRARALGVGTNSWKINF